MSEKVFCSDCEHYFSYSTIMISYDHCSHDSNTIKTDTYKGVELDFVKKPAKLNKNNDCKNFEPKK